MKLTEQEKSVIKNELFRTVKNSETRSRIITTAYGFAHENGEDGDVEKMVSYLMDNPDKLQELFNEYALSAPFETEKPEKKKKKKNG